jgi:sulfane dehydrogenase subunit SoxC
VNSKNSSRRRFLRNGAGLAGLALGGIRSARAIPAGPESDEPPAKSTRAYGDRSPFEKATRSYGDGSPNTFTPLQDLDGIITPSSLHYVFTRGIVPIEIDPQQHRLMIHGLVERPLIFTMEELKRFPAVSRIHFIECVANTAPTRGRAEEERVQERFGKTSCSEWTGVPLSTVLKECGVKSGAGWLLAESADKVRHSMSITMEKAMDDALLAYGQNGEAIRPDQGYPLRLLVPGWEGVRNVKWLRRIQVGDKPFMTHIEVGTNASLRKDGKARWFNLEMGPKSVITRPSGGQQLPGRGFYEITGLAWSGGGTVKRVEVSTDGGRTWADANLQTPVLRIAHTRFRFPWKWNGEETVLQSRCTDERGIVQPSLAEIAKIWGVEPAYFRTTTNSVIHFNPIQPWKVTPEGGVKNVIWEV